MELKYCPKAGGLENVLPEVRFWQCSLHEQHLPKIAMLACAALPEQPHKLCVLNSTTVLRGLYFSVKYKCAWLK